MKTVIGIDVSSETLDACILKTPDAVPKHRQFENSKKGVKKLRVWASSFEPYDVIMEGTGGYEKKARKEFIKSGIAVRIVNPKQVRHFAKGIGKLCKTDRVDAYVIARFCQIVPANTPTEVTAEESELKAIVVRRNELVSFKTAEKQRLGIATGEAAASIKRTIRCIEKELERVLSKMKAFAEKEKKIRLVAATLKQQTGVGDITSISLSALLPELGYLNRKQISALAGLAPFDRKSGKWNGKSIIGGGRALVRKCLYMPAWIAVKYDERLKAFYNNLVARGKSKKLAITAVMRKLLVILNAKVREARIAEGCVN